MTLTRIEVGGEAPYPVIIGTGVLAELPQLVGPAAGTVAVISGHRRPGQRLVHGQPLGQQLPQPGARVADEQRPGRVQPGPVRGGREAGRQVHHPLAGQQILGGRVHHRPPAERQDPAMAGQAAGHRSAFQLPEGGFAVGDEDVADRLARGLLDDVIGVQERGAQQRGSEQPDGRLARPRRADQDRGRPAHGITSEPR